MPDENTIQEQEVKHFGFFLCATSAFSVDFPCFCGHMVRGQITTHAHIAED
jgi:hypothetical protein